MLSSYYSWFDFHLIKDMIKAFCNEDEEVTRQTEAYKHCMKKFSQRRLCELPQDVIQPTKDAQLCVFKVDKKWKTMRINQIELFKNKICGILKLKKITLRFCSASSGSVLLKFLHSWTYCRDYIP